MKKLLFVLLVLPFIWVGCEKPEPTPLPLGELKLTGTWEWTETSWASPEEPLTPETEGYSLHLTLTEDNKFTYYHNCVTVAYGSVTQGVWKDTTTLNQEEYPYMDFYDHVSGVTTTSFYELYKKSDYEHTMTTYLAPKLGGGKTLKWKKLNDVEVKELFEKK